jgi:hypothetical protein
MSFPESEGLVVIWRGMVEDEHWIREAGYTHKDMLVRPQMFIFLMIISKEMPTFPSESS